MSGKYIFARRITEAAAAAIAKLFLERRVGFDSIDQRS
jgi:hypothetical protein